MSNYPVGTASNQVTLAADIDTFGLAASRAIVVDLKTTASALTVGHSVNATGDISRKDIGLPNFLKDKRLSVMSKIDLLGTLAERKAEAARLSAKYIMDEGPGGPVSFSDPIKVISKDFTNVILFKVIDLIS